MRRRVATSVATLSRGDAAQGGRDPRRPCDRRSSGQFGSTVADSGLAARAEDLGDDDGRQGGDPREDQRKPPAHAEPRPWQRRHDDTVCARTAERLPDGQTSTQP